MAEKAVVLERKPGRSRAYGTKLIPFFDARSAQSVETIGSYFAPEAYRDLSDTIFVRDNTCHKEVFAANRARLTKPGLPARCYSPPKSPGEQRRVYMQHLAVETDEVDYQDFMDSIDGNLIPADNLFSVAVTDTAARVSAKLRKAGQDEVRCAEVVGSFLNEARENYITGVKRAIIEYVLSSRDERKRLEIARPFVVGAPDCLTIRAPVPWHETRRENAARLETRILTLAPLVDKVRRLWYARFAGLDLLESITFPVDVQYFRSQVTLNCQKIKFALIYEWVAAVSELFVETRKSICMDLREDTRDFHLMETIATLTGRLLRQLTMDNIYKWVAIASPAQHEARRELFVARANFSTGYQCQLDPSPNEWPRIVAHPINEIIVATSAVPRIERQLILLQETNVGNAFKLITSVKETDFEILAVKAKLLNLVSANDSEVLLREADNKILRLQNFKRSKRNIYDLAHLRQIIAEQELFEEQSVYETDFNWAAGIMLVNYSELKRKMAAEAMEGKNELIKNKVVNTIALGHRICNTFREMRAKIEQVCGTTSDLMANKKLLNEYRATTALLFKDIEYFQDHWCFLVEEGAPFLSDTDFELFHKLYHWPQVIRETFRKSDQQLGQAKQKAEATLLARIAKFENELEEISKKILSFKKKRLSSPLEKVPDNVKTLASYEDEIEAASAMKVEINYEEGLFGWHTLSRFETLEKVILMKKPLDMLWQTSLDFGRKSNAWLTMRVHELDVSRVKREVSLLLRKVEEMFNAMNVSDLAGDEDVKQNIATLDKRITDFKTLQLPLLSVVTLPVLREKHWRQMSALLNHRVTPTSVVALADMIQSQEASNPAVVSKIEQIGKTATREHALEIFLARMKNEWISDDWPEDALDVAANKFLEEESMEMELKEEIAEAFKYIHESARLYCSQNMKNFLFPVKVTPPSFIELILTFKGLLKKKQNAIASQKYRYKGGVDKLELASAFVKDMKRKVIEEYQPQLLATSRDTEVLMIKIETETYDVELAKEKIASDENLANRAAAIAQQMRDECTKELAEAVPAMQSAIKALDTLNADDIVFLKTMKNPPLGLKMVLEAVAILLGFASERRLDANGLLMDDYWSSALRMLNSSDIDLLEALKNYDKDHVRPEAIKLIRENYLSYRDFDPMLLKSVSYACESIAKWVKALDIYDRVINVIKPKKQKLFEAEKDLTSLMDGVYHMKSELQEITDRLQGLSDEFASISKEKRDLEENISLCDQRVQRAETLIEGLDMEKDRWKVFTETLDDAERTVVGDTLLASAFIVYLSALAQEDRSVLLADWQMYTAERDALAATLPFSLVGIAGAPLDIQTWILAGLQTDAFCVDNATIVTNTKRFPVIIDPMSIANDWITRLFQNRGLILVAEGDEFSEGLIGQIKRNITRGKPVLLENVTLEQLKCPFVESLLSKDIENEDGVQYINILGEEVEYSPQFNLFMTRPTYGDFPRSIYGRVCFVNWNDEAHAERQRIITVDETIRYKERAKKEKQLIEMEDKLLECLSASDLDALDDENAIQLLMSYKNLAQELEDDA